MNLDAGTTFDRVNWEFLDKVLGQFGFHQSFITVIQEFFKSPRAIIKFNGALSTSFDLRKGACWGCQMSLHF